MAVLTLLSIAAPVAQATDLKSLTDIERVMDSTPPHPGNQADRVALYTDLDQWVEAPDTFYWMEDPKTSNPEFRDFYLRRINRVLNEVKTTTVTKGAVIWKLYSSGFLIKTPTAVFAIDAVEGPIKNQCSPRDISGITFKWTEPMREEFARLVDVLLITHWHYDHASWALAQKMIEAGKQVVTTEHNKEKWQPAPFAAKLTTLSPGVDHKVGPLVVRVFDGVQWMGIDPKSGDPLSNASDVPDNVYLIRDAQGATFLHQGDNRGRDFKDWAQQAVADGWHIDVWLFIMSWPKTLIKDIEQINGPTLLIPGHEYEFCHKRRDDPRLGMNKLMNFYTTLRERCSQNKALIMSWGEHYRLEK